MSNKVLFSLVMLCTVFISACSQIILKKAALRKYSSWLESYLNPAVIGAYAVFFLTTMINVYALKYVPLTLSAILETTSYIYVPILSSFVLKEKLSKRKGVGILIIIAGIVIFSL